VAPLVFKTSGTGAPRPVGSIPATSADHMAPLTRWGLTKGSEPVDFVTVRSVHTAPLTRWGLTKGSKSVDFVTVRSACSRLDASSWGLTDYQGGLRVRPAAAR